MAYQIINAGDILRRINTNEHFLVLGEKEKQSGFELDKGGFERPVYMTYYIVVSLNNEERREINDLYVNPKYINNPRIYYKVE
jgi:hypothetical protein